MRLIDADKLKIEVHSSYSDDLGILEMIDAQDTVDNNCVYNSVGMSVGDQKWLVVKGNNYKFVAVLGTLKKISKKDAGKTYYTFKYGYTTTTFVDSSFGKKVFYTKTDAENTAKELNEKE